MAAVTVRFIFISDAEKPVVALRVPEDMLFQEAFVAAAKKQGKNASVLTATFPGGSPISGGTVKEVAERSANIHVIDPSIVGLKGREGAFSSQSGLQMPGMLALWPASVRFKYR